MVNTLPVGAVLRDHLVSHGLPADCGRSLRWIRVRFLGVPIVFPNFDARRAILFWHDVHHLLTGYATDWAGEAEIGGYEIASGCRRYWAAWFFNFGGWLFGLVVAPRRLFAAFVRGRCCTNFYGVDEAHVASLTIAEARAQLGLDQPARPAHLGDGVLFVLWTLAIVAAYVVLPVLMLWFVVAR